MLTNFHLDFEVLDESHSGYENLDLLIKTPERMIRHDLAMRYWSSQNLPIHLNAEVFFHNNILFSSSGAQISTAKDLIIDCSWGSLGASLGFYEQFFITYVIRISDDIQFDAFTLMDGPFFSIFPYGDPKEGLYTLTHVKYGVIKIPVISEEEKLEIYATILLEVKKYLTVDVNRIILIESFISRKLKPISSSESRDVSITINDERNFVRVYSGKIDTIFHAVNKLDAELGRLG